MSTFVPVKAGFAGQSLPSKVYPTVVAHLNYDLLQRGESNWYGVENTAFRTFWEAGDFYVGEYVNSLDEYINSWAMTSNPVKDGYVSDWDDYEKILHHTLVPMLKDRDLPVILTASPSMFNASTRQFYNLLKMISVMFEDLHVPAFYLAYQPVLSLYANGLTTGMYIYTCAYAF